ncbi:MAG: hypothetical protein L6R00_20155 [Phycisphaerae bacterium]|nr:hypothetical protein [Phycisphaerae bacterium]
MSDLESSDAQPPAMPTAVSAVNNRMPVARRCRECSNPAANRRDITAARGKVHFGKLKS